MFNLNDAVYFPHDILTCRFRCNHVILRNIGSYKKEAVPLTIILHKKKRLKTLCFECFTGVFIDYLCGSSFMRQLPGVPF